MLKRFGASSKHRKAAGALKSSIIMAGQPETNEEEPASTIENNKVTLVKTSGKGARCAGLLFEGNGLPWWDASSRLLS